MIKRAKNRNWVWITFLILFSLLIGSMFFNAFKIKANFGEFVYVPDEFRMADIVVEGYNLWLFWLNSLALIIISMLSYLSFPLIRKIIIVFMIPIYCISFMVVKKITFIHDQFELVYEAGIYLTYLFSSLIIILSLINSWRTPVKYRDQIDLLDEF